QKQTPEEVLPAVHDRLDMLVRQFDQRQSQAADAAVVAVNDRLDTLVLAVDQLAASAERPLPVLPADETPRQLTEAISRLDERFDQLISEGRSATSEIEERVSAVDRAVAQLNRESPRPVVADPASPLDQALHE